MSTRQTLIAWSIGAAAAMWLVAWMLSLVTGKYTGLHFFVDCWALLVILRFVGTRRWLIYRWVIYYRWVPECSTLSFNRIGVEMVYKGDTVIWTWPWRYRTQRSACGPWISLGFTGNGDFGDARFHTLADLDKEWRNFEAACIRH